MINEARGERWEHLDMSFGQFLLSGLTGAVRSEILSDEFPTSPHDFCPFGESVQTGPVRRPGTGAPSHRFGARDNGFRTPEACGTMPQ
ncbi:hypothetical protein [Kitasatospora atroaurantiaca]|uniref:Uncharacterized protein n=1 Tax=Kitasatospora atroaurantiaca TaxID=285545 RepID=A0A561EXH7_9ACTN|nr:hypothetical protein [Kitasatospora atroaurantiaca]TWE20299.1 hypothetical protein FB465_5448 [Kitasatospora atroaurantiaca]